MSPTMLLIFMPSINPNTDGCLMMIATGNVFIAQFVFFSPGNRILEIIPGNTMRNRGVNFRYPAKMVPAFAFAMFLAARAL